MVSKRRQSKRSSTYSRYSSSYGSAANSTPNARRTRSGSSYGSAAPRVSTVKLGDLDAASSKRAGTPHVRGQKRGVNPAFIVLGVVALLAVCLVGAYWSNLFTITKVTVSGVEHLTASEMAQLANVPSDTTLLRVDTAQIKSNIVRDAWVADVDVQRIFPDTLNLAVTERKIGATVQVSVNEGKQTELWAISADGMWLCEIPDRDSEAAKSISQKIFEDADSVFTIKDVAYGVTPQAGSYCTDESVNNALKIVTNLTTDLKDSVKAVSATSTENTTLTLDSNVEIAFGAATDIRDKERVIQEILSQNEGSVSYINVRVVKNPTWRSAN